MAWRYGGGGDTGYIWRLYHDLDEHYLPWLVSEDEQPEPRRPLHPWRYKAFLYACALYCEEMDVKLAGGKVK